MHSLQWGLIMKQPLIVILPHAWYKTDQLYNRERRPFSLESQNCKSNIYNMTNKSHVLMQHMLLHKQCIWAERQRRLGLDTKNHLENQKDLCSNPGFFSVTPKHPPQAASFIALQPPPQLFTGTLIRQLHLTVPSLCYFTYKISIITVSSLQKLL